MHNLLHKLLRKRGVEEVKDLTPEEKITFDSWHAILSKDELTTEDIKSFCSTQLDIIESKWKDYSVESSRKAELIPYHTVYKSLLQAIDSPKAAREQVERQLTELTK